VSTSLSIFGTILYVTSLSKRLKFSWCLPLLFARSNPRFPLPSKFQSHFVRRIQFIKPLHRSTTDPRPGSFALPSSLLPVLSLAPYLRMTSPLFPHLLLAHHPQRFPPTQTFRNCPYRVAGLFSSPSFSLARRLDRSHLLDSTVAFGFRLFASSVSIANKRHISPFRPHRRLPPF